MTETPSTAPEQQPKDQVMESQSPSSIIQDVLSGLELENAQLHAAQMEEEQHGRSG